MQVLITKISWVVSFAVAIGLTGSSAHASGLPAGSSSPVSEVSDQSSASIQDDLLTSCDLVPPTDGRPSTVTARSRVTLRGQVVNAITNVSLPDVEVYVFRSGSNKAEPVQTKSDSEGFAINLFATPDWQTVDIKAIPGPSYLSERQCFRFDMKKEHVDGFLLRLRVWPLPDIDLARAINELRQDLQLGASPGAVLLAASGLREGFAAELARVDDYSNDLQALEDSSRNQLAQLPDYRMHVLGRLRIGITGFLADLSGGPTNGGAGVAASSKLQGEGGSSKSFDGFVGVPFGHFGFTSDAVVNRKYFGFGLSARTGKLVADDWFPFFALGVELKVLGRGSRAAPIVGTGVDWLVARDWFVRAQYRYRSETDGRGHGVVVGIGLARRQ